MSRSSSASAATRPNDERGGLWSRLIHFRQSISSQLTDTSTRNIWSPDATGTGSAAAATIAALARPAAPSLLHRDLHDKQLLVDGASIGMLDVDTLGLGDPALDLGNLLAHLDLRVRQGWTQRETAAAVEQGVLDGYVPDDRTRAATAGYRALAAARLEALYAFRPGDLTGGGQPAK